jgi:hypothetical protein
LGSGGRGRQPEEGVRGVGVPRLSRRREVKEQQIDKRLVDTKKLLRDNILVLHPKLESF